AAAVGRGVEALRLLDRRRLAAAEREAAPRIGERELDGLVERARDAEAPPGVAPVGGRARAGGRQEPAVPRVGKVDRGAAWQCCDPAPRAALVAGAEQRPAAHGERGPP